MKAKELIELLSKAPEAEVRVDRIFTHYEPLPLEPRHVVLNNEANTWIITPPNQTVAGSKIVHNG